ncbi:MAG: chalcone isomerase family protein [Thermodesulfobacteriota bacterium]|nr:chalcone isomerase family protein [Thermodesulfobacteriota bacterium]
MMKKKSRALTLFFVLALLGMIFPAVVMGLVFKGVDFPDEVVIAGKTCKLMGVEVYKAFKLITIEYCGFYLSEPTQNAQAMIKSEQIKRLRAHVIYELKAKEFRKWYKDEFDKINNYESNPELKEKVDQYLGCFTEDFNKHDEFRITYIPGNGTEIMVKGEQKAIISGRDFMLSLYAVWFGPESSCKKLSNRLLGIR